MSDPPAGWRGVYEWCHVPQPDLVGCDWGAVATGERLRPGADAD